MVKLIWSPDAIIDLENITEYISLDSEEYATIAVRRIFATAETVSLFPSSGRIVPEFAKENIRENCIKAIGSFTGLMIRVGLRFQTPDTSGILILSYHIKRNFLKTESIKGCVP